MNLLIVESPSKAKTINKYLGKDYKVIASFGHIRELPSKTGSVLPEENFAMTYHIPEDKEKYVTEIVKYAKQADNIYLATDPDREGESISWHVGEILKNKRVLKNKNNLKRVTFNEITKKAVTHAVANPRDIDDNLVNAQQARLALDYLVGFTLSPLLWRKLPGCRSAGRVQSVALKLICNRQAEIEAFKAEEYWDIHFDLLTKDKQTFTAKLTHIDDHKLAKFDLPNKQATQKAVKDLQGQNFQVKEISEKQQKRQPAAPFITSSLQQEAARKLGFGAKKTMQIAQKLYEGIDIKGETIGLITYMRTDGVTISEEAIKDIRKLIKKNYGEKYLAPDVRVYKSKAKNAQEAHEAIRPTDITITPDQAENFLTKEQFKLYELIWKRTLASQMENVILKLVGVDLITDDQRFIARATGSIIIFDGFYKLYREGSDEKVEDDNRILPPLEQGQHVNCQKIKPEQHFTEPPPRYSEASLVKKLEELGIGRPSTYASIISVLQERKYVKLDKKRFEPSDLGRLLSSFLQGYFSKYVEYDFTAQLEEELDQIAAGQMPANSLLNSFWDGFIKNIDQVKDLPTADVIEYVAQSLDSYLFGTPGTKEYEQAKICPKCTDGQLSLRLSKYGGFLSCSNYPECDYRRSVGDSEVMVLEEDNSKELGLDSYGQLVSLKKGPYGWYVQLGENADKSKDKKHKPKRSSLLASMSPETITLQQAIDLLSLPLQLGVVESTGEPVEANIGRYGPYVKYQGKFVSIPKHLDIFKITLAEAEKLIAEKKAAPAKSKKAATTKTKKATKGPKK